MFLIAQTDENGVDPRPNPHDTALMGRALHGSQGAAPVVASKQTGPAPHRSQQPESTPAGPAVAARRRRPLSPGDLLPPGGKNLRATGAGDSSRATPSFRPRPPSDTGHRESHPVCRVPTKRTTTANKRTFRPSPTHGILHHGEKGTLERQHMASVGAGSFGKQHQPCTFFQPFTELPGIRVRFSTPPLHEHRSLKTRQGPDTWPCRYFCFGHERAFHQASQYRDIQPRTVIRDQ